MLEDFIYFYGSHEMVFSGCILLLFLEVFIFVDIFYSNSFDSLFMNLLLLLFASLYFILHFEIIMPMYDKIEKKRYPCKYPIDIKYYYEYEDLNGNINKFIGDYNSCTKNCYSNNFTCHYDGKHVQVVSYSLKEEYIYANGCDKE